jgi:hypothetical protein
MIKIGDKTVPEDKDIPEIINLAVKKVVDELKPDLQLNYWEEMLDTKGIAKDWGIHIENVRKCTRRKVNPLKLIGGSITRKEGRNWYNEYYDDYKSKNS